ncbi:MAG: hypothetical protein JWO30_1780 [Fibrobacteres bacterium]|nr:hypothetical protein [Fibrobacterota bacterium]
MSLSVEPGAGSLSASIFENQELGIRKRMVFSITVPVTVPFEGKPVATEIQLDFIRLAADGLEDMEDTTYWFPVNPADGYIDGSLFLGEAHNPVDCTRLAFGKAESGSVPVEMEFTVDFTYEGPEELGIVEKTLTVALAFNRKELDRVFAESANLF